MFSKISALSISALAISASALVVPRATPPAGWATDYLEPYQTYHTRYLALSCQTKHSTTFFDQCCHPLLAHESLSSRPSQCTPSASASASASAAEPTSTVVPSDNDDDDEDCDDEDDGDDDDEDCDDEDTSSAVSSTVHVATSSVAHTTVASSSVVASTSVAAPATSSAKPETSSAKPKTSSTPAPTTTAAPTTTFKATSTKHSSSAPAATTSSSVQTGGFATFFYQNGVAGACGKVHAESDLIAAIDVDRYGNTGVASSLCGKQVKITNTKNKKSVTVTIADACPTCENSNSIDLSVGAFTQIATEAEGMVAIDWEFV